LAFDMAVTLQNLEMIYVMRRRRSFSWLHLVEGYVAFNSVFSTISGYTRSMMMIHRGWLLRLPGTYNIKQREVIVRRRFSG
jgi:hypothetical protein